MSNFEDSQIIDLKIVDDCEPLIELDVMADYKASGNSFKQGTVLAKALDICEVKMQEKPVIVVLKTITQCKDFLHYFRSRRVGTDAYVFDAVTGDSAGAFGILNTIRKFTHEHHTFNVLVILQAKLKD